MDLQAIAASWGSKQPAARAVLLFGSRSRGDWTIESDIDLAVACDAQTRDELAALKGTLERQCPDERVSLSVYSTRTLERMAAEGSLFLWHLKLEGRPLWERGIWWTTLARAISDYSATRATRDITTFLTVLGDCERALNHDDSTLLFEAATTFAALRGIGMIRGMLEGQPCFSRAAAWRALAPPSDKNPGLSPSDLTRLLKAKLVYSGKGHGEVEGLEREWCSTVVKAARRGVRHVRQTLLSPS